MPFNGQGTFNLEYNWQTDAANGLNISSSRMQAQDQDIANALSNCVTRDGQGTPNANIAMSGYKFTGLGNGANPGDSVPYSQVQSLAATAASLACPIGSIIMWNSSAAAIPSNFQLCNGTNGTPNLEGSFIIGAGGSYANGSTGGASSVTLSVANMPSHNHGVNDPTHNHPVNDPHHSHTDTGHTHTVPSSLYYNTPTTSIVAGGSISIGQVPSSTTGTGNAQISSSATGITLSAAATGITTQNNGSGTSFSILPPYYALCFIQRMS